jgi:hypothetical protein
MAHYAFLDENNIVTQVIVGRDEDDLAEGVASWEEYYGNFVGQRCLRTSYNTQDGIYFDQEAGMPHEDQSKAFRGNYAGIGYYYDEELDAFIPPAPHASWIRTQYGWEAPVPHPTDGGSYMWDEESGSWVSIEVEPTP